MNAKYRRLFITIIIILTIGLATKLILMALEDNIVYFYTPNDLIEKFGDTKNVQNKIRIGGLVLESSIKKEGEKCLAAIWCKGEKKRCGNKQQKDCKFCQFHDLESKRHYGIFQ